MTTALVPIEKIITKAPDGWHVWSHDKSKHLGGPYATKVQAQRRLRQVEHFKDVDKDQAEAWVAELRKYSPSQPRDKIGQFARAGASAARATGAAAATAGRGAGRGAASGAKATGRAIKPTLKVLGKVALVGAVAGVYVATTYHTGKASETAYKLDSAVADMLKNPPKGASHASAHIRGDKIQTGFAGKQSDFAGIRSHFTVDSGGTTQAQSVADASRNTGSKPTRGSAYTSSYSVDSSGRAQPNTSFIRHSIDKADDGVLITMPLDGFNKDEFVKAIMATVVSKAMLDELRKGYNPNQPREKNGRFARIGGSALGVAANRAGRAVRGAVTVANAKKIARGSVTIAKPIIKTVGKAAFAGAMAGLVMGVEHTFSNAGSDVGRAAGAAAAAAAKDLHRRAEEKSDMLVTARIRSKGAGRGSVTIQGAQRVDPKASSFNLVDTSTPLGSTSPYGRPINTPGASDPRTSSAVRVTPFMAHSGVIKGSPSGKVSKADDAGKDDAVLRDDDILVVMALDEFDEQQFGDAVNHEISRVLKRMAHFTG